MKISVLMTVFNRERYVREAIDSILNQTFQDFELIIVNDASTDNSGKIASSYNDPRIQFIENTENQGLVRSLQIALKHAQGEYLARQDDDDVSLPTRFEKQVAFLNTHPDIYLLGTSGFYINAESMAYKNLNAINQHEDIIDYLKTGSPFCHGSIMLRRSCLDKVEFYREKFTLGEDYDFFSRITEHFKSYNLKEPLYRYRRITGSMSMNVEALVHFNILVRMLAQERKEKGKDSLDQLDTQDIPSLLSNEYGVTKKHIQNQQATIYIHHAWEAIRLKNYSHAFRYWWKSFQIEPAKWKIKMLFKELFKKNIYKESNVV